MNNLVFRPFIIIIIFSNTAYGPITLIPINIQTNCISYTSPQKKKSKKELSMWVTYITGTHLFSYRNYFLMTSMFIIWMKMYFIK